VALFNELIDITTTKSSLEQEHDILDHVFVGNEVEESRKRFYCLCPQVLEFCDQLN